MDAYHQEFFGPVVTIYKIRDEDDAVRLANDSPFGLAGAVFSKDHEQAERVAQQLDVGMSHVNIGGSEAADMPFGGVKRSGFGRELGPLGMDEFVNKRLLYINKV
jgi:succinate-semialdehyde dehydrogenase/glutarate-semialdehyde dehydrogenase